MREDLTKTGVVDLTTPDAVDEFMKSKGTTLIVVNSVCGCAAGSARPGVKWALSHANISPDQVGTVFAGVDTQATAKAREYMAPYRPSSPSIALFKDGQLVHMVERHQIEGNTAQTIGEHLIAVFEEYC
jgi:putative YphP/YqiW family bacilliredoxin